MKCASTYALFAVVAGVTFPLAAATANDKFDCWQPTVKLAAAAAGEYWTEERRRNAIPDDDLSKQERNEKKQEKSGEAKLGNAERVDVSNAPFKFGGKLFYTRDSVDYSASAQFVAEDNVLLAAAHSMWRGDKGATNVVFYRGYSNGGGTKFDVDYVAILKGWPAISNDQPSYARASLDYAALRTTSNSDAGKFSLSTDNSFTEVTMIGYPSTIDGGEYMNKQLSSKQAQIDSAYDARPNFFSVGASGGAWYLDGGSGVFNAVSGVSGTSSSQVIGPAYSDTTGEMIAYVKGGCSEK